MSKYSSLVLFGVFSVAAAAIKIAQHKGNENSVNLALETVFEFENIDKKGDVNLLNKVERFIGKVKNVIEKNHVGRRRLNRNKKIFTQLIGDVLNILDEYDDNTLHKFVVIFTEKLKEHHYKGCEFHELVGDIDQQRRIENKLAEIRMKPITEIRNQLKEISVKIHEEDYVKSEKALLDAINSIYHEDSSEKINVFLRDIGNYKIESRRDVINLTNIINNGLKSIVFDHYTNLTYEQRTKLKNKLQGYIDYCNQVSLAQPDIRVFSSSTSKMKQNLRTLRQMYVEEDLEMKYAKATENINLKSKRKDKQTKRNHRPHSVPTTRKVRSEYNKVVLREGKSDKRSKKYRFLKVNRNSDEVLHTTHKKRLTKELTTLRQMYVEKNIDLKYDPDAYQHLTTKKQLRKKVSTVRYIHSPITKRVKNTKDSFEILTTHKKHLKHHKIKEDSDRQSDSDKETESTEEELVYLSSGTKLPDIYKVTKLLRNFEQLYANKDLDYDMHPTYSSNDRKLTFKTLYPTFVIEVSTTQPRAGKYKTGSKTFRVRLSEQGHRNRQQQRYDRSGFGLMKQKHSVEPQKSTNRRYHQEYYRKNNSGKFETRFQNANINKLAKIPITQPEDKERLNKKVETTRDAMILARQFNVPHKTNGEEHRKWYTLAPMISEEGLSIEGLNFDQGILSRRVAVPTSQLSIDGDKKVLKRIKNLESELELVKIKLKNETRVMENLKSIKRKISQTAKIIQSSKTNLNFDDSTESGNSNTNEFNIEIPERKKSDNYVTKKRFTNLNVEHEQIGNFKVNNITSYNDAAGKFTVVNHVTKQARKALTIVKESVKEKLDNVKGKEPFEPDSKINVFQKSIKNNVTESKASQPLKNIQVRETNSTNNTTDFLIYFRTNDKHENKFNEGVNNAVKYKNDTDMNQIQSKSENNKNVDKFKETISEDIAKMNTTNTELNLNSLTNPKDGLLRDTARDITLGLKIIRKNDNLFKASDIFSMNETIPIIQETIVNVTSSVSEIQTLVTEESKRPCSVISNAKGEEKAQNLRVMNKEELKTKSVSSSTRNTSPLQQNSIKQNVEIANVTAKVDSKV